jgi:hypothetical protein
MLQEDHHTRTSQSVRDVLRTGTLTRCIDKLVSPQHGLKLICFNQSRHNTFRVLVSWIPFAGKPSGEVHLPTPVEQLGDFEIFLLK